MGLVMVTMLVALIAFVAYMITRRCRRSEGYAGVRPGAQCDMMRTPVDYVHDLSQDPHYKSEPTSYRLPLKQFPIDFWSDLRNEDKQFKPEACNQMPDYLPKDSKTHHDLINNGDLALDRCMFGTGN